MEEELDHQAVDSRKPRSLPPGWETVLDPTQDCWFFVSPDGNTQWEHPDDVVFGSSPRSVPAGWQILFSEQERCWFFLSPEGHTQWEHPEDGKIYKLSEETTGGTMRPIEEANSSQVIEVISSPSCPTEWQCFYCSEYCCWYFVSDEVKQWTHPQDGKTYKKREEATCETIQTLPASSSSASSSLQEGLPMHRLTQEPVHPIILISCGWNKQGGQLLESFREKLWHRVDEVFDSWDHLNWYGTDPRAQSQFLNFVWRLLLKTLLVRLVSISLHMYLCANLVTTGVLLLLSFCGKNCMAAHRVLSSSGIWTIGTQRRTSRLMKD